MDTSEEPLEVRRDAAQGLTITWQDGSTSTISCERLRKNCPCAFCRAERQKAPRRKSLSIVEGSPAEQLRLEKVWAVGNYGLGVLWGDGHKTGIYSFRTLKELAGK